MSFSAVSISGIQLCCLEINWLTEVMVTWNQVNTRCWWFTCDQLCRKRIFSKRFALGLAVVSHIDPEGEYHVNRCAKGISRRRWSHALVGVFYDRFVVQTTPPWKEPRVPYILDTIIWFMLKPAITQPCRPYIIYSKARFIVFGMWALILYSHLLYDSSKMAISVHILASVMDSI